MTIGVLRDTAKQIKRSSKLIKVSVGGAIVAPLFLVSIASANPTPTNAYVAPTSEGTGDCTSAANACDTFAAAMGVVTSGGTIYVAGGTYTEDINVSVPNITITLGTSGPATVSAVSGNYGVSIINEPNVTISDLDFVVPSGDNGTAYALHSYDSRGLTLFNDNFSGTGSKAGGVDINSTPKVNIDNVSATNFAKNGFAFTAKYASTDELTSNVVLNNITASNNAWAGVAFYTTNSDGTVGGDISGVSFEGVNTISGNGQTGVFLEGDSDKNLAKDANPSYTVSGPNSARLSLGNTSFSSNYIDIFNYQSRNVEATSATFSGLTGNAMNQAQRAAENLLIIDQLNYQNVGYVYFFNQAIPRSPRNGIYLPNAGWLSWHSVPGAISYNYESSNSSATIQGSNKLASIIYSTNVKTHTINATGTAPGTYFWQVQPVYADGSTGLWSAAWRVNVIAPQL